MASPALSVNRLMTAEELLNLAPVYPCELVRGELVTMSPSGTRHGFLALEVAFRLRSYLESNDRGAAFVAEAGFIISRNPDTVRAPDVAFVKRERLPEKGLPAGFFPGPPDLAVEVVSPWDRYSDVKNKIEEYLTAGSEEVWLFDPQRSVAEIHTRPGLAPRTLAPSDVLTSPLLPGFELPLERLFPPAAATSDPPSR